MDVATENDIGSPEDCLDLCIEEEDCRWSSYFGENGACLLTENCIGLEVCDDCSISNVENPACDSPPPTDTDGEKISYYL